MEDIPPAETRARWAPKMDAKSRDKLRSGWSAAVAGTLAAAGATQA
jgi:hypothetical protein